MIITAPFPQSKKLTSRFVKTKLFNNKVTMNASITVLLMTNKTGNKFSSFFTNDADLGWVSYENSKKDLNLIRTYGSFKVLLSMEKNTPITIEIKKNTSQII